MFFLSLEDLLSSGKRAGGGGGGKALFVDSIMSTVKRRRLPFFFFVIFLAHFISLSYWFIWQSVCGTLGASFDFFHKNSIETRDICSSIVLECLPT